MIRERVKIEESSTGGSTYIPIHHGLGMMYISQRCQQIETGGVLRTYIRKAELILPIEQIMTYAPGDILKGNIYTKESTLPVDYGDTMLYLKWKEDGTVDRTEDGQAIYSYNEYSESNEEGDEWVVRRRSTADH